MDITLPTIPAGILTLLAFFAPFAQSLIQRPEWSATVKRVLALVIPALLAAIVLVFYFVLTGDAVPSWPVFVILAIIVAQAAYAFVLKAPASELERKTSA